MNTLSITEYEILLSKAIGWFYTGSRVIGGASESSDYDVCALARRVFLDVIPFDPDDTSDYAGTGFVSYKFLVGERLINLLVFFDKDFFFSYKSATRLARLLRVTDKATRVALFQAICANQTPEGIEAHLCRIGLLGKEAAL